MEDYISNIQDNILDKLGIKELNPLRLMTGMSPAQYETFQIVFNTEQFQLLLDSLQEARCGKIVTFREAFSDLD